jgi:hypothetical protein
MIFISYRRDDTSYPVTGLASKLKERYGDEAVFIDFDDLTPGRRWQDQLRRELLERQAVLALIGKNWKTPRLNDPQDWVRQEICTGIREGKMVIVLRLDNIAIPPATELPQDCELPQLHSFQNLQFRPLKDYDRDFDELCLCLERELPDLRPLARAATSGPREISAVAMGPGFPGASWDWPGSWVRVLLPLLRHREVGETILMDAFPDDSFLAGWQVTGNATEDLSQTLLVLGRCSSESSGCSWPLLRYLEAIKESPLFRLDCRSAVTEMQVRWLESRYPVSDMAKQLRAFSAALGPDAETPMTELESDYYQCAPRYFQTRLPPTLMFPRACAAVLASFPPGGDRDQTIPLLQFSRRVRNRLPCHDRELERWEEEAMCFFAKHYDVQNIIIDTQPTPKTTPKPVAAPKIDAWLTVLVCSVGTDGQKFAVKGWLFHSSQQGGEALLNGRLLKANATDLPNCLRSLRSDAIRALGDTHFQVELVVPPTLRDLAVDDWPVSDRPSSNGRFGELHPIVIRCLRRLSDRPTVDRLRRRWEHIMQTSGGTAVTEHLTHDARGVVKVSATVQLEELRDGLVRSERVVGALFTRQLAESRRRIDVAVGVGLPLVVWPRTEARTGKQANDAELTALIGSTHLTALPSEVWARRGREHPSGSGPIFHRLAILLDDPSRIPPDLDPHYRFRPPSNPDRHE